MSWDRCANQNWLRRRLAGALGAKLTGQTNTGNGLTIVLFTEIMLLSPANTILTAQQGREERCDADSSQTIAYDARFVEIRTDANLSAKYRTGEERGQFNGFLANSYTMLKIRWLNSQSYQSSLIQSASDEFISKGAYRAPLTKSVPIDAR
jgi:hypothetical protein